MYRLRRLKKICTFITYRIFSRSKYPINVIFDFQTYSLEVINQYRYKKTGCFKWTLSVLPARAASKLWRKRPLYRGFNPCHDVTSAWPRNIQTKAVFATVLKHPADWWSATLRCLSVYKSKVRVTLTPDQTSDIVWRGTTSLQILVRFECLNVNVTIITGKRCTENLKPFEKAEEIYLKWCWDGVVVPTWWNIFENDISTSSVFRTWHTNATFGGCTNG